MEFQLPHIKDGRKSHWHTNTVKDNGKKALELHSSFISSPHTKPRSDGGSRKGWWELPGATMSSPRISLFPVSLQASTPRRDLIRHPGDDGTRVIEPIFLWRRRPACRESRRGLTGSEIHQDNLSIRHLISAPSPRQSGGRSLRLQPQIIALRVH